MHFRDTVCREMNRQAVSKNIEALFFDYGGTLDSNGIAWKEHFWPFYEKHGREHGITFDYEQFVRAFYKADDSLVDEGNPELNLTMIVHEQVRRVLDNLDMENIDSDRLAKTISNDFIDSSLHSINNAIPVLNRLKQRYRLGIISNNYGNLEAICKETGLDAVMEVLIDSRVVGATKPDPVIFRAALDEMETEPQKSVMIGDSFKRDIEGALNMGMNAIWLVPEDRRTESENLCKNIPVPIISSISELPALLLPRAES